VLAALKLEPGHRVLEIGTGSGFTAAVMSSLSGRVTTVERYRKLCDHALQQFVSLKRENIMVKHADGRHGMPGGPFDRIILWLACEEVPRHFVELLATHGVLIAPIGPSDGEQIVTRISKVGSRFEQENLMVVRYQPFIEGVSSVL
jgi:protein-L-isoaspartate(D-aspartate) O-methyltransferase